MAHDGIQVDLVEGVARPHKKGHTLVPGLHLFYNFYSPIGPAHT